MTKVSEVINKQKQLFQEDKFSQLYFDVVQSFIMHQEFDLANIIIRHPRTEEERMQKLIDWILAHKFWLFSLSGGLESILDIIKTSQKDLNKNILQFK